MRSVAVRSEKKPLKTEVRKSTNNKKKKMVDLKQPLRDTISETISFVIKGKLTPIKPIMVENKFNLLTKSSRKKSTCDKILKKTNDIKRNTIVKSKFKQNSKTKSTVESKNAKKTKSHNIFKKVADNIKPEIISDAPKMVKKNINDTTLKHVKTKFDLKTDKKVKQKQHLKNRNIDSKSKKVKIQIKKEDTSDSVPEELNNEYSVRKQKTIDELLKQVNEEILEGKKTLKLKKDKSKSKVKAVKEKSNTFLENEIIKNKVENISGKNRLTNSLNTLICDINHADGKPSDIITFHIPENIKLEQSSDVEKSDEEHKLTKETKANKCTDWGIGKKPFQQENENKYNKKACSGKELNKKKPHCKLKTKPKMTIMKKRVSSFQNKSDDDKKCKTKLFGFWNGPKPHRVASLNALAKVHCLYENETRGNILDMMDEESKLSYAPRKDSIKSNKVTKIKDEIEENDYLERDVCSPLPTRTLRSVPGLRGVGKHWDMHDSSSSSDYISEEENEKNTLKTTNNTKQLELENEIVVEEKPSKVKKRCRRRNEIVMDLKDMVVRKRMASLNASAILAASYSLEKRQSKSLKDDDDDESYDDSSDEYFSISDDEIKQEDEVKKEEDRKLIEVHTSPNKKVAVILNQDTDVTITGVYVNSTTRSTHHEGYCSIAGMQYRISATSHTQTAATAVATETLLHSSSSSAQDNNNSDSLSSSSKSYTPLEALSNMQPPPGPGIQHNHPIVHSQQPMGPPQHVLPIPPQLSPGLRHSCSSAFSSPHSTPGYQVSAGHQPGEGEQNYVHGGYYQPAGPLITVSHAGSNAVSTHTQPPVPLTKASSLSEASPTSTTPSVAAAQDSPPTGRSTGGGDSSDSEVIITSVTAAKEPLPPLPSAHSVAYRYGHHPFSAPHPNYSYTYHSPYTYHTAPPPPHNSSYPPPQPHDLCYSSYGTHKYVPSYRRYVASPQYYPVPGPGPQDIYSSVTPSNPNQQVQQMVSASPSSSGVGNSASYPPTAAAPGVHPPPTILETFPAPQATLVEAYQPPPPPHYYSPPSAYGPAPSCYTQSPTRTIPYINAAYQSCPCPMQSCPKNGLTGPLTGNGKRSNITNISKDSMPLPPVALALPLEPNSVTGPPSPARGSAGMPPPPSPAGATYQSTPLSKQESQSPSKPEFCNFEKKKARIGKAMVRNNIAAGMQQNTMLLMCNPQPQNYFNSVKREIESPKEKESIEVKGELFSTSEDTKPVNENLPVPITKTEESATDNNFLQEEKNLTESECEKEDVYNCKEISSTSETLPPVVSSVAENVKVKNMKRKMSFSKEAKESELAPSFPKQRKLGSYKCLIKKEINSIKINNGKRKLIKESLLSQKLNRRRSIIKLKKPTTKRKLNVVKEQLTNRSDVIKSPEDATEKLKNGRRTSKNKPNNSGIISKSSVAALDSLFFKNSIDRTIESVVSKTSVNPSPRLQDVVKTVDKLIKSNTERISKKKCANNQKQNETESACKKIEKPRKSRCNENLPTQAITKPRRSLHAPRWSNGWRWEGESYQSKVFINSDEMTAVRKCYPAMMHETGDKIVLKDCVLLKAGPRKNDLPFVAKIASLWENPEDGEMMMSLLWYYRPEHTEQGRLPTDQPDEVFASRHKDSNSVACIDDKCYVLTFNEYCRYRKTYKRIEEGIEEKTLPCIPNPVPYPRSHRQPPTSQISPEMVFFCRRVYDFRQKRIMKNPT